MHLAIPAVLLLGTLAAATPLRRWAHPVAAPKVVIVSMFEPEDVWTTRLGLTHNITVPGLSPLFPDVHCSPTGEICHFVTGEGEINAAATVTALLFSDAFDFTRSYFLIAGIAGVNPHLGTLGTVGFARFAVQVALAHELDARQIPSNWSTGYWLQGTTGPGVTANRHIYGSEVFELNTNLRERILPFTHNLTLNDSDAAVAWRAKFDYAPANQPPSVILGDVATSDVYYTGTKLCETFGNITAEWTQGAGVYAFTAQEDNASFEAMIRAHLALKMDFGRVILMRTASDIDREPLGMGAYEAFVGDQGGFEPAVENIFVVGNPVVQGIVEAWDQFKDGVLPQEGWAENADALHSLTGHPVGARRRRRFVESRRGRGPMNY